jgi:hypothetical protein
MVLNFVISILGILILGYLAYWKDYMKAKGKNLATVEDIEKITKITGDIKNDLAVAKDRLVSFQTLKRKAIIDYFEILIRWCNHLQGLTIEDGLDEKLIESELKNFENEDYIALGSLELFDEDFDSYKGKIYQITNSFRVIGVNYRMKLGSFLSIKNNAHLYEVRRNEFFTIRSSEVEKFSPLLKEITLIFRKSIKEGIEI